MVRRGSAGVLVAMLALATAGCGGPEPLDPTSDTVARQKKAALETLLQGARAAADQFGAGTALGVRTDTVCDAGIKTSKIRDFPYRSECTVQLTTAYAVDSSPMPALSGLDESLTKVGWSRKDVGWTLTRGRGGVVDLTSLKRRGYQLEDLVGPEYAGPQDPREGRHVLHIRAMASSAAVPPLGSGFAPHYSVGLPYFASKEGADWQVAWTKQRSQHPYLLLVRGSAIFATQPW